jgi:hypothetical protein
MRNNESGFDRIMTRGREARGLAQPEYVRPPDWQAPHEHWHWSEAPGGTRLRVSNEPDRGVLEVPWGLHGSEAVAAGVGWLLAVGCLGGAAYAAFGGGLRFLLFFVPAALGVLLLLVGERVVRIERTAVDVVFEVRWGLFLRRRVRRSLAQRPAFSGRLQNPFSMTRYQRLPDYFLVVSMPALLFRHRRLHTACTRFEGSWIAAELDHWSLGPRRSASVSSQR